MYAVQALLLIAVALPCHAQITACSPATGPNDERAVKIATLNAVSADVRARFRPETAGSMQISNEALRTEISSVVSAKLKNATVVRRDFVTEEGRNPRLCVEVVIRDDAPAAR